MIMSEPASIADSNTPTGMLEGDLVKRARRGDLQAYDELVQAYPQIEDFLVQLSQKRLTANASAVQPAEVMDADTEIEE